METLVNEGMSWQMQDELNDADNVLCSVCSEEALDCEEQFGDCNNIKKKKFEFSKFMVLLCFLIGISSIVAYYLMLKLAIITPNCMITPDSSLAVTGMSEIVGSVLGYFLYQGFLKNSRNKYNVDDCGKPWENAPYK